MYEKNNSNKISRRRFLNVSISGSTALGSGGYLMASMLIKGCGIPSPITLEACHHDCPDTCSWKVTTENGKVIRFDAVSDHPYTRGKLCAKMDEFPWDVTYHPDRVLYPLKRTGRKGEGRFEKIS